MKGCNNGSIIINSVSGELRGGEKINSGINQRSRDTSRCDLEDVCLRLRHARKHSILLSVSVPLSAPPFRSFTPRTIPIVHYIQRFFWGGIYIDLQPQEKQTNARFYALPIRTNNTAHFSSRNWSCSQCAIADIASNGEKYFSQTAMDVISKYYRISFHKQGAHTPSKRAKGFGTNHQS